MIPSIGLSDRILHLGQPRNEISSRMSVGVDTVSPRTERLIGTYPPWS